MPRRRRRIPKYRHYKPKDLAVVRIDGVDQYLGRYSSPESLEKYHRLVAEWLSDGQVPIPAAEGDGDGGLTVTELIAAYWRHAEGYYRKDGGEPTKELGCLRDAMRPLQALYGRTAANDFGPKKLKAVRQAMIDAGLARTVVNGRIGRVKRAFRWAAAEEIILATVHHALTAVDGLRKGRTKAREPRPIEPVPKDVVDAMIPHLPEVVADMVRLQRLCGCRPAEVCIVRPMDIDTSGDVWVYRPESHKAEHHGRERIICIGPKGQDVLRLYLLRPAGSYCFLPQDSERKRLAALHEKRKTPLSCGNRPGTNRKRRPKRKPGERYNTTSYRRAIHRAVDLVNRERKKQAAGSGTKPELLQKWGPNRLRHSAATEIRRKFGLEAAQVTLGHAQAVGRGLKSRAE